MSLFHRISKLTWLPRITLILFVIVLTNSLMVSTTGYSLLGGDLFTIFFIGFLILLGITLMRPVIRRLTWRVRNRLLLTYFFVGVLPVLLSFIFVSLGLYLLLSQTANYLLSAEIERRLDQVYNSAQRLAEDISAGRGRTGAALPGEEVIVRTSTRVPAEFPTWSMPGFRGIVTKPDARHFFAAHATAGSGERRVDVFAYQVLNKQALAELLPGLASLQVVGGVGIEVGVGRRGRGVPRQIMDSEDVAPAPAPRGFWDLSLEGPMPLPVRSMDDGTAESEVLVLQSRLSAVLTILFSHLGPIATALGSLLLAIAGAFLLVEIAALIFSAQLARTLTRTVHDLYVGTRKLEGGDFSHRIPVRTKDQLSDLATSFNSMTQRIEKLIVEVKDKEKLEAELEIARHVQSQLFPKEVPKLKTLELIGMCNPARVVSGDYYDFIPLDERTTAVVIGDISGKGISAALLMASLQSSLHAQLAMGAPGSGAPLSTAALVARLNRQLYENTPPEKYATFYCGFYDDQNSRLLYTNAGHLAPFLVRRSDIIRLQSNGMVVGMFPDFPYEESVIELQSGDLLTAFTDGITESENAKGEQFGEQRLADLLLRYRDRPLDEIVRLVTDTLRDWASDIDNQDDTTILLARRL